MITIDEVKKLANLSRIEIAEEDMPKLAKDLEAILGYISLLEKAPSASPEHKWEPPLENVMREDGEWHDALLYRENILANFPKREGDYLKVMEVISYE
ncbi:MAG: hypothetical protein COV07_03315 [Candidatus Vogelbacteria bacterium CG10_big_fil_rev_8_21_14_0_10_45_14]|uniref:Aspartyl/glutamyl-tRNA(Asn/Gln) amidotransferase subunit C n=1 Tax=Candidatus Vogelbacteria bacterium CG10_big_fil_rev_8_21_14_0_10_45_14 TaxID=1975042 RepID=A0A2H0RJE9_9BACT|nr:MAG: hypothetical protein COV07_03315 [Candidatus Vogelbacteria bacterium CG10_big_fil_rev_8_21_14_0_10_45_14]